jgi:FkbM family methyltransferase
MPLPNLPASQMRDLDVKATYNLWSRLKWKLATIGFYLNRISALPRAQRLFRDVERGTLLERNLFGHRFVCDVSRAGPQKLLYLIGERHVSEANLVRSLLAPGMNVVDVGANIGHYTLMFAQVVGPQGRIIAIEPSPENLPELTLNVERNNLRNVEIVAKAVGDTQKGVGLSSGINSGVVRDEITPAYSVEQDLIDNIITEPIDFMKLDVEGYEVFALEGAQRILSKYRPTVFLEIHPLELKQYGCGVSPIINRLSRIYDKVTMYEERDMSGLYKKVCFYYAGMSSMQEIGDQEVYMSQCETGEIRKPFWVVCRK